ncbi:hypothetical protein GGR57DRAFT_171271 [Xylariaceae sp. FL1272]|nr:hypothetical protein GGR57DRAFT_171271 [Xylariaceae sp. FL1272]
MTNLSWLSYCRCTGDQLQEYHQATFPHPDATLCRWSCTWARLQLIRPRGLSCPRAAVFILLPGIVRSLTAQPAAGFWPQPPVHSSQSLMCVRLVTSSHLAYYTINKTKLIALSKLCDSSWIQHSIWSSRGTVSKISPVLCAKMYPTIYPQLTDGAGQIVTSMLPTVLGYLTPLHPRLGKSPRCGTLVAVVRSPSKKYRLASDESKVLPPPCPVQRRTRNCVAFTTPTSSQPIQHLTCLHNTDLRTHCLSEHSCCVFFW